MNKRNVVVAVIVVVLPVLLSPANVSSDEIRQEPHGDMLNGQFKNILMAQLRDKPVVNVKDLGARGDGTTNDAEAFRKACAALEKAGGGTLVIPKAIYSVGGQVTGLAPEHPYERFRGKQYPYYKYTPCISIRNVEGLLVEGNGSTLKMTDGLRIGSFEKNTGEIYLSGGKDFTDYDYQAAPGNIIEVRDSRKVLVRDLELDGNSGNMILGGPWGDAGTGRQCMANGIALYSCSDTLIENIHTHHNGLDGIMIAHEHLKEGDPPAPITLRNVRSEYNARQGLSWVGGKGLTVLDSQFNHTGRARFHSAPGAGLDIEAEVSICRDGYFRNCKFINNIGCGVVADCGDGGYTTFEDCVLWGTTNWALWNRKPGMKFKNCDLYGSIVWAYGSLTDPDLATQFRTCRFEDKAHPAYGVYRGHMLVAFDSCAQNVLFEDCDFLAHEVKALWLTGGPILRNCRVTHAYAEVDDHDFQSLFGGGSLEKVHFMETFPENFPRRYAIVGNISVDDQVRVDGPVVRWGAWNGSVGQIKKKEL